MPTTFGEPFSHPIFHNPSSIDPSDLPLPVAQYRQNLEHQRRKSLAEHGTELDTLHVPGSSNDESREEPGASITDDTESPRSSTDEVPENGPLLPEASQMKRKNRIANSRSPNRPDLTISTSQNGQANGHANGKMNTHVEMRRKNLAVDSPSSAQQAANLMSRESFTLDDEPTPVTPHTPSMTTTSYLDLPVQDRRNFLLLVLLYFLQGIPMGLAGGSVPFLLKSHLSYGQIGIFSLAIYPYSLKLLWSPIVDAIWSRRFGRRKSWITPIQTISGLTMIYLGKSIDDMMDAAGNNDGDGVWGFTSWWFLLVFLCATQDIAVDGWALTLLSPQNISYASTAQTVGLTAGSFLSHTVFLAFNAPDFTNRWFRTSPKDYGLMTLGGYLEFWGWTYLLVTLGLAILKREEKTKDREGIVEVYQSMLGVLKLRNILTLIVIHLMSKIGFVTNESVTNLKLLDKEFGQANLALVVLIDFPFEISLGYYAGKWSTQYTPLRLWCWAFAARLAAAVVAQLVVMIYPDNPVPFWYLLLVIASHVFTTFMNTIMFVASAAFHARIADPVIGGTYMTLLATVSNLGGTFPKFFLLKMVDLLTVATCVPGGGELKADATPVTSPFSCVLEADKHRCVEGGGTCNISRDGYYYTNVICVIIGVVTFWGFIQKAAMKLQALPLRAWRVSNGYDHPHGGN